MSKSTLLLWAEHLRALAAEPARAPGWTPVIPPSFAAWRNRSSAGLGTIPNAGDVDDALWRLLASGAVADAALRESIGDPAADGPLCPDRAGASLEVWTERELSALHCLHWLARDVVGVDGPKWRGRILSAVDWHIRETQPDNATNRPWALHLFLILGEQRRIPEARLYAETLLSNAQVVGGRPDPLSAMILADAADALEEEAHETDAGSQSPG